MERLRGRADSDACHGTANGDRYGVSAAHRHTNTRPANADADAHGDTLSPA